MPEAKEPFVCAKTCVNLFLCKEAIIRKGQCLSVPTLLWKSFICMIDFTCLIYALENCFFIEKNVTLLQFQIPFAHLIHTCWSVPVSQRLRQASGPFFCAPCFDTHSEGCLLTGKWRVPGSKCVASTLLFFTNRSKIYIQWNGTDPRSFVTGATILSMSGTFFTIQDRH